MIQTKLIIPFLEMTFAWAIRLFFCSIADAVLEGKRLASEGQEMIATEGIAIPQEEIEEAEGEEIEEMEEIEEIEEIVVDNNDNKEEEENVSQEEDALCKY